jgi:probable F420-dependent oxidoreductase
MKLGVAFPTTEIGGDPGKIRRFIAGAESADLNFISHPDHVLKAPHNPEDEPLEGRRHKASGYDDPLVFCAYAAGVSDKLELSTGILILPQRQTALVAHQVANIDLLTRERFRLGVGIGWSRPEYEGLGQDFSTRGRRVEEQIHLLRRLWAEPRVTFKGEFDSICGAGLDPLPKRQVPIYYGGFSDAAYERGARLGDGYMFVVRREAAEAALAVVRGHLKRFERDEATYGLELMASYANDAHDTADMLKAWRDLGGTHGSFQTSSKGNGAEVERHIDYMAKAADLFRRG